MTGTVVLGSYEPYRDSYVRHAVGETRAAVMDKIRATTDDEYADDEGNYSWFTIDLDAMTLDGNEVEWR